MQVLFVSIVIEDPVSATDQKGLSAMYKLFSKLKFFRLLQLLRLRKRRAHLRRLAKFPRPGHLEQQPLRAQGSKANRNGVERRGEKGARDLICWKDIPYCYT